MHRHHTRLAALLAVVVLFAAVAPAPVAADDEDDDQLASVVFGESATEKASVALSGLWGKIAHLKVDFSRAKDKALGTEPPDTEDQADELKHTLNSHSGGFVNHTNLVLDEYDGTVYNTTYVLQVDVVDDADDPDKTSTVYVVASANGTELTSLEAVDNTTHNVSKSVTLDVYEARRVNEQLDEYHDEYVSEDEVPEPKYYARIVSEYTDVSEITVKRAF